MENKNFEDLVLDLYKKQVSGDYVVDNKLAFTGAVTLRNSTIYFNEIKNSADAGLDFLSKNISDVEKVHLYSSKFDYDVIISKPFFQNYKFKNDGAMLEVEVNNKIDFFVLKD